MQKIIKEIISSSLSKLNFEVPTEINIEIPKQKENGDYSSNICLKIAAKNNKTPMELAELLKENIKNERIKNIEIKNPGFINFFVDKKYLLDNINHVIELSDRYGSNNIGKGKKVNYEYVSANPTGILHTGNARGGAYGDNMARILKFSGFDVTREYYINDAGNQIINLGLSIKSRYLTLCGIESQMPEDGYYGKEIEELAKKLYEKNSTKLIDQEINYFSSYGVKELINRIIEDLKLYGVEYDVLTSEKDIYDKYSLDNLMNELTKKGYTYEKEGALWFKSSELLDDKDHVLVKNDGNYTYLVPDIAYHQDKINRGFEKLVDILGTDHHGYVNRIKSGIMALGYDPNILDIKLLQLVRLVQNGEEVKMSKRTGKGIALRELIEEIGVNAARYFFASRSLDTQMEIDLDLAVKKSNDNPVYYVSYAYARICSIIGDTKLTKMSDYSKIDLAKTTDILEKIYYFPKIVEDAATKEIPHLITNYVYDLATSFHYLYNEYRFIDEDENLTMLNLNLLQAIKITMYNALNLIGVTPPEKM
ncbi:MAG: arginine--tRNA ligase [Mollicutes bacterium]|nr:arginine--tRNA ligase [Mollicutes bacterium]